jgi:hypothetical protein
MKVLDKVSAGVQAGANTLQSTGKRAAEEGIRVGADKAVLGTFSTASALGGVGVAAALSAGISQMEYEHKKKDTKKFYKEELAAHLGKSEHKVKDRDVDTLAKNNRTLAEHMGKMRKERNLGIGVIFAATLASLGVVALFMFPPVTVLAPVAAILNGGGLLAFATKAAIAIASYSVVKNPLQKLGDRMFDMDKKTTHERIEEIHRDHEAGRAISRERVFAVFVHSNPELDQFIESRYGKKFDELSVADKIALADTIGSKVNLAQLTDDINHGRIKAHELAFAVDGTMSGVAAKAGEIPKHGVLSTIKEKLHDVADTLTGHPHEQVSVIGATAMPAEQAMVVPNRSFVEKLGRAPIRTDLGHVQRLDDARTQTILATSR